METCSVKEQTHLKLNKHLHWQKEQSYWHLYLKEFFKSIMLNLFPFGVGGEVLKFNEH